jgi:uncharacterized protein
MSRLFGSGFCFVGVVHLLPLPGGPRSSPGFADTFRRAMHDAEALAAGGAQGVIVENLGDAPFSAGAVEPHVVAFVARVVDTIRRELPSLEVGVNLLRNDARGALGVAAAADAQFIRVNVHTGAMLTDQGVIQGDAHRTLRYRQELRVDTKVIADVLVKHAVPLGPVDVRDAARDTWHRGGVDALVISGSGTGAPADPERVEAVRAAVPQARVWLGSGVTHASAEFWRGRVHGAIVGSCLHAEGVLDAPLDRARVRDMAALLQTDAA